MNRPDLLNEPPDQDSLAGPLDGAPCLGYLAKMFPRISETFILDEIRALRSAGLPVRVYSLLPPTRDARVHPEALELASISTVLPAVSWRTLPLVARAFGRSLRAAPGRTIREGLRAMSRPTPRTFRLFARGVVLADRMRRDRIVHLHAAWAHGPASAALAASRLTGIPWSMAAHAKDIHLARRTTLTAKLRGARFTLACTQTHQELLREAAGDHGSRIELIRHGVDVDTFFPADPMFRASAGRAPVLVSVGRLVAKKGFDVLLNAVALLRGRGLPFTLEIVGEGTDGPALERRVLELGLGDIVRFRGMQVRSEIRDTLRQADCFVLASRVTPEGDRDGIPNTVAEAMACGLPVVSSRLPSIEELVSDGETGLLVPAEDPRALAEALERVLREPALRERLGQAARARVLETFDARRSNAARVQLFRACLSPARVLYVTADRGVPVRGSKGASIHVRSILNALRGLGVEARVVTARSGPDDGPEAGCPLEETRTGPRGEALANAVAGALRGGPELERALLRLLDNIPIYRTALGQARAARPDFVYERYALTAIAGSLLARRLGVPHVLEVNAPLAEEEARHRGLRLGGLARALEGWIWRRADRLVVVSRALERHARALGVKPERIVVLPNAIEPALFHPGCDGRAVRAALGWEEAVVVGFSGTLKPWHGVEHLIRALGRLATNPTRTAAHPLKLLILGDGPERARLVRLAEESGMAEHVRFRGTVPHERMGEQLAACDILCAPYGAIEGFYFSPIKVAEYVAVGRPVVAAAIGQLVETFDEACGVVSFPAGDEEALARILADLADDPGRRAILSRAAAESVRSTWADVAREVLTETQAVRARRWGLPRIGPLRVGYVLKMFPRFSETFIVNEILALERQGVRIAVVSMKPADDSLPQPAVRRVAASVRVIPRWRDDPTGLAGDHLVCFARAPLRYVRTLFFAGSRRSRSAWIKFLAAPFVVRWARAHEVEHLHAHFASGPARQAKFASMLSGIPFSFTAHAKDLFWSGHQHGKNHKLKKRVRAAAFLVAISDYNRRFIEGLGFKVPRRRLVTVYNGLDLSRWRFERPDGRPLQADRQRPLVLAVGRLVEKKGFPVLVEACRILRERGVEYHCAIAGDGPERKALRDRIRESALEDQVALLGSVPQDRLVGDFYLRAQVLAQPCLVGADGDQDGIPMVILEAMAIGLPVVTTPVSGIAETVTDGESALVVPPVDPYALADALERALTDPALAARLAQGARRRIEERFDLGRNTRVLRHLMTSSARQSRRWSLRKLRERVGLEPLEEEEDDSGPGVREEDDAPGVIAMPGAWGDAAPESVAR